MDLFNWIAKVKGDIIQEDKLKIHEVMITDTAS